MCCFSQPVDLVSDTRIFARGVNASEFLVYRMTYAAAIDLAMVLPLPVPVTPDEDAVTFINLERYPDFFSDMDSGFCPPPTGTYEISGTMLAASPLKVHNVGAFEASFVPRIQDFSRLDDRFVIPADVWSGLPEYRDYGFAVFKLRATSSRSPSEVHPMALEFRRRNPQLLYFPTVHVHDRMVHP